jgi:xanthine dehydrogenase accessory factor
MDLLEEIISSLRAEDRIMVATIISTTGSTPASALSKMVVKQGGIVSLGTVGGGCTEGDVLLHASRLLRSNKAEILTFRLDEDDLEHGLICGGSLDVLIEPLSREQIPLIEEIKTIRDEGEDCILATYLTGTGDIRSKCLIACVPGSPIEQSKGAIEVLGWIDSSSGAASRTSLLEGIPKVQSRNETVVVKLADGAIILEPVAGAPSLLIFGGGHVSKYISRTAAMAGFRVTIIDDREKFANRERFPEAVQALAVEFVEAFRTIRVKPSTYIVIVTRGHRHDEAILGEAIKTSARYIGMIGSKRKVLATFEHLIGRGVSPALLGRVRAPMGIDLGAVTAEEIGISVVAELVAERRGGKEPFRHKSDVMTPLIARLETKKSV